MMMGWIAFVFTLVVFWIAMHEWWRLNKRLKRLEEVEPPPEPGSKNCPECGGSGHYVAGSLGAEGTGYVWCDVCSGTGEVR